MTNIYLIRHAEAEGNLYRRIHGQYNSLVTENGYRQIKALQDRFQEVPVDAVYSSDLFRTMTTARALYVPKRLQLITDPGLREINMGIWEDRAWAEVSARDAARMELFSRTSPNFSVEGGETFEAIRRRATQTILRIASQHPDQNLAIFSHGTVIRNIQGAFLGIPIEQSGQLGHSDNTAVTQLEVEDGKAKILSVNDNSHLSDDISTLAQQNWWKATEGRPLERDINLWYQPIRLYLPADRAFYLHSWKETWNRLHGSGGQVSFDRVIEDAQVRSSRDPYSLMLVLDGKYKEVGLLQLAPEQYLEEKAGYVSFLYLEPDYRYQGLGVQLLGQAISYYRPKGRETLRLASAPENTAAQNFYRKHGFRKIGEVPGAMSKLDLLEKYIGYDLGRAAT